MSTPYRYQVRVVQRDGVERYLREGLVDRLTESTAEASRYFAPEQAAAAIERYLLGKEKAGIYCDVLDDSGEPWRGQE